MVRDNPYEQASTLVGLIAECDHGKDIILFDISLGHAGEHLDKILSKREVGLPPPTVMSDALSSNTVTKTEIVSSYCNAHARRQFYDLEKLYPNEVGWLLERYAVIWKNEDFIEEQGLDKKARLQYHQKHSLPVMQEIQEWALKNRAAKEFEEHSAFGKATLYFLKHYDRLIMFCKVEGALIDNNRMEEKLKLVIRVRKTSHFYKTPIGAEVANVLTSIISTTNQAQENIFDYLQVLQKNQALIKLNPSEWLPWNYRETFELLKSNLTVEDQV
jgi:transposase